MEKQNIIQILEEERLMTIEMIHRNKMYLIHLEGAIILEKIKEAKDGVEK